MTAQAPERIWSGIDIGKTVAGTLAAITAAVIGSFLGVAGTLIGAAVASIVGSVGTEIYHRLVNRGSQKIKETFVAAPAAVGTPSVVAAEHESPSQPEPEPGPGFRVRWGRAAMVAGALFVLAMGSLTVFELISHKSVADAVGGTSSSSTTFGSVMKGKKSSDKPAPVTSTEAPAPGSSTAPAGTEPSGSATPSAPASGEPTETAPGTAPGTVTPTTPADTGDSGDSGTTGNDVAPGEQSVQGDSSGTDGSGAE